MGVQIITAIMENSMGGVLKDLEIEIQFDPAIPLLGIYPKGYKSF